MTRNEFVDSIGIGHNLGNALECFIQCNYQRSIHYTETEGVCSILIENDVTDINGHHDFRIFVRWPDNTYSYYYNFEELWSNVVTPDEFFSTLVKNGVNTLRVPVNLISHIVDTISHTVDTAWLDHIRDVISQAVNAGLKCIISLHTDYAIMCKSGNFVSLIDTEKSPSIDGVGRLMSVWSQLASHLNEFSADVLAFELANEFQLRDIEQSTSSETLVTYAVNLYRHLFKSIRGVGGNAAERFLLIGGYRNNIAYDVDKLVEFIDTELDDRCIISTCYYSPWQFTVCGVSNTWEYDGEFKEQMDAHFQRLLDVRNNSGIPIVISEYGVGSDDVAMISKDKLSICKYIYFMMKWFHDNNFSACIWDPGYLIHRTDMSYGIPFWNDMVHAIRSGEEFDIEGAYEAHKDSISFLRCTEPRPATYEDLQALDAID